MKNVIFIFLSLLTILLLSGNEMNSEKSERSFKGKNITQIGMIVKDIEKSSQRYAEIFGMEIPEVIVTDSFERANTHFKGEPTKARAKLAFFHFNNITIELIEPIEGPSTWLETLEKKGEGFHHIALEVDSMDTNIKYFKENGGSLLQKGDFTGGSYAYVDMENSLNVIIEPLTNSE